MLLAIDLYCGLGGWADGFLAHGYTVIGFDIERHIYGEQRFPAQLVLQDVLTLHGSQFKDAAVIVASPPCQEPSYRAMPWSKAKALNLAGPPVKFMELFNACFRIQREACEAAGHHIPLIVENVKGAQPWVGRAKWHFGSYYLWGDIPALMPISSRRKTKTGSWDLTRKNYTPDHSFDIKNNGGSWFAVAHNTESGHNRNPVTGEKTQGHVNKRDGFRHTKHLTNQSESDGVKMHLSGPAWFDAGVALTWSGSKARRKGSAEIARIPFPLAEWIARCFKA